MQGTTPMYLRNDPVQAAAAYIDSLFRWAQQYMEDMVCTVGSIRTVPGNSNVIASEVIISFDIRSAKKERIEEAGEILHRLAEEMRRESRQKSGFPVMNHRYNLMLQGLAD